MKFIERLSCAGKEISSKQAQHRGVIARAVKPINSKKCK